MKINVERGAFLKALNHVQSVVERRNTIPILSNVLIEAAKGELKLTATDLDIEIVEALPADVLRNGSATAPAHMLYDIVRKLPEGAQVQAELLSSEGGRLAVSAGTSRFELACLPREDFPQMAAGTLPHKFRLAADDLKRIIDKTRFAISTEETRYYLNGIYLHAAKDAKPKVMRAVATDGHRLARYELELPDGAARHARRDRAPQDGGRTAQASGRCRRRDRCVAVRHQDPVRLQRRGTDLQADRRQFPAL